MVVLFLQLDFKQFEEEGHSSSYFLYPLGTNTELISEVLLINQLLGDSLLLLAFKKNHLPFEKILLFFSLNSDN